MFFFDYCSRIAPLATDFWRIDWLRVIVQHLAVVTKMLEEINVTSVESF